MKTSADGRAAEDGNPEPRPFFHEGIRAWQDHFDSRRLADRLEARLVRNRFSADDRAFIEGRTMLFLATADEAGRPNCSYKGSEAGFARLTGDDELAFPSYDGNGMFRSVGNLSLHAPGALYRQDEADRSLQRRTQTASLDGQAGARDTRSRTGIFPVAAAHTTRHMPLRAAHPFSSGVTKEARP